MDPDPPPPLEGDVEDSNGVNAVDGTPAATATDTSVSVIGTATAEQQAVVVSQSQTTLPDKTNNKETNKRKKRNADHLVQAQTRVSVGRKIKVTPTIVYYWLKTAVAE